MKYSSGNTGKILIVRFDHNEDLFEEISFLIKKENIAFATINLFGALRSAEVVTGPKTDTTPPVPNRKHIDTSHEIIGFGTITYHNNKIEPHIHVSIGREESVFTGCLRALPQVFIVVEAIITEITGLKAFRKIDTTTKQKILDLK